MPLISYCYVSGGHSVPPMAGIEPGSPALASLIAQSVKSLPGMQETWVQFLGGEDPLEKEMATLHCWWRCETIQLSWKTVFCCCSVTKSS